MQKNLIKSKKSYNFISQYSKGFALIFTLMIVSIISVISAGMLNSSFKQMVLSSLARDSEISFYQADTAADCALYADLMASQTNPSLFTTNGGVWSCGGYDLNIETGSNGSFTLKSPDDIVNSNKPCFDINIEKIPTADPLIYKTDITARGYNICNKSNPKVVEREIEITY